MKIFKSFLSYLVLYGLIVSQPVLGQQRDAKNGYSLPVHDTVKTMVVFAQIDQTNCGGSGKDNWPDGSLPSTADTIFDHEYTSGDKSYLTQYYYEASYGQYIVLGDYIDHVFTVPKFSN